ncbi:MAG: hypothetical protein ABIO47_11505 [Sphingomicrobium sp.]
MTNEERFIATCEREGEAGVRQKLNAGRFSERKTEWATSWLDQVDSGKSETTRAQERNVGLLNTNTRSRSAVTLVALLVLMLVVGAAALYAAL